MDETHHSRVSDAAATRKRRSSILKSQRQTRTPFSELEFNVATPTECTKSRRVSFSRRTGVAEFVTNEATTTWKNFYEEHNKSLELSGNESGPNARQPIGHIGQTMFDRQFQEVEAVDFITSLDNLACGNINTSLNNFTEQLASLESTNNDRKPATSQNKFELSAFTDQHSKFFADDLAIPIMGEMSGRINVNFSVTQNVGADIGDDLDEIQRDLQTVQSNIGPQPFGNGRDLSEYIEVELNSTHVNLRNEESDMSITETIQSPKLQNVSKTKTSRDIKELELDKENKCIPDIEPKMKTYICEMDDLYTDMSMTSAIPSNITGNLRKEEATKICDEKSEKRKTIIFDDDLGNLSMTKPIPAQLLPIQSDIIKSNIYKLNAWGNSLNTDNIKNSEESTNVRRRTIVYEQDDVNADMSVTVAVPQNIYDDLKKSDKRNTVVFGSENADISITAPVSPKNVEDSNKRAVPMNNSGCLINEPEIKMSEKRKTIIFDDDLGNLSMTKPIPAQLLPIQSNIIKPNTYKLNVSGYDNSFNTDNIKNNEESTNVRRRTIVYEQDDVNADMSVTVAVPQNIYDDLKKSDKRNTVVFGLESANISITNPVPQKNVEDSNEQAILTNDAGNPRDEPEKTKVCNKTSEKRKTIIFDDELANLSMTKPIPAQLLPIQSDVIKSNIYKLNASGHSDSFNTGSFKNSEESTNVRRRTIVYEQDDVNADMSVTVAVPQNIYDDLKKSDKRNTVVFGLENADISITAPVSPKNVEDSNERAIPMNDEGSLRNEPRITKVCEKRKTIIFDDDLANLSMTKPISAQLLPIQSDVIKSNTYKLNASGLSNNFNTDNIKNSEESTNVRRRTIVYEQDDVNADMSVTVAVPQNIYDDLKKSYKRNTVIFGLENADISITMPVARKIVEDNKLESKENHESVVEEVKMKTYVYEMDDLNADMSITSSILTNVAENLQDKKSEKRKTIIFDDDLGNLSMTRPIPAQLLPIQSDVIKSNIYKLNASGYDNSFNTDNIKNNEEPTNVRRRTIVYEQDDVNADMSVTVAVPQNIYDDLKKSDKRNTVVFGSENADISITALVSPKNVEDSIEQANIAENQRKESEITVEFDKKSEKRSSIFSDTLKNLSINANSISAKLQALPIENEGSTLYQNKREFVAMEATIQTNVNEMDISNTDISVPQIIRTYAPEEPRNEQQETIGLDKNSEKRKSVFNNDLKDMACTKPVPDKLLMTKENNGTVLSLNHNESVVIDTKTKNYAYDVDDFKADMSTTFPTNITNNLKKNPEKTEFVKYSEKRRTIMFDELENLSITKSIPAKFQSLPKGEEDVILSQDKSIASDVKTKSYTYEMDDSNADMSVASAILSNVAENPSKQKETKEFHNNSEKRKTMFDDDLGNLSMTKPNPAQLQLLSKTIECTIWSRGNNKSIAVEAKMGTYVSKIDDSNTDISISSANPMDVTGNLREEPEKTIMFDKSTEKRRTVMFDDELENLSMTKPIPTKLKRLSKDIEGNILSQSNKESVPSHTNKDIVVCKVFTDETSEVKIPSHLKNVSEDIKSLMNDLVKPMADIMPFSSTLDKSLKESSTCNTEVQANLVTSSQVDLTIEQDQNIEMFTVIDEPRDLISSKNEVGNESDSIQNKISSPNCLSDNLSQVDVFNAKEISFRPQRVTADNSVLGGDLVFDYHNPLNNVLLGPMHNTEVHKYNPTTSNDTLSGTECSNSVQCVLKDIEVQNVTVRYGIDNDNDIADTQSFLSNISKPGSIDQSIDAKLTEVKDMEVNTLIVMKENSELLQASSSLTLVDDALARSTVDIDTQGTNSQLKVIYKIASDETSDQNDTDMTSTEEINTHKDTSKSKKRGYSPNKRENNQNSSEPALDVTPKPISKMQKISNSPSTLKNIAIAHFNEENNVMTDKVREIDLSDSVTSTKEKNSPQKSKGSKKPGTSITVQQLMTEYNIDANIDQKMLDQKILEALKRSESSVAPNTNSRSNVSGIESPDIVCSFTSSKKQGEMREESEVKGVCEMSNVSSMDSSVSWLSECESSLNVVAKIDMLPFMGSHECEWESSGMDSWSFRLLHARLRLHVRLQHRHHNAARTRVRADTPVRDVTVQRVRTANEDKKSVASVCVGFAAEAMQRLTACCVRAGDVPALLRAAATTARQARRWGRAMHRARAHLAYKLTAHGITLNVANIPLRCVWEVSMKMEMVFEPEGATPWPRAVDVQAKNVLTSETVPEARLRRALARVPTGWGHVPGVIWQIFKYLKNKTQDDELLGI